MKKAFAAAALFMLLFSVYANGDNSVDPQYGENSNKPSGSRQTSLGKEYLDSRLRSEELSGRKNELSRSLAYDYSPVWLERTQPQNGVIGTNYQRIEVYIGKVTKSNYNPDTYLVTGKSKVNKNICDFSGEIRLIKLFYNDCYDDSDPASRPKRAKPPECAVLFAEYTFYEDSAQNHTGVFGGIMECSVRLHKTKMLLDDSRDFSDGYSNRTFVGTWTDYKIKKPKKCIWGDYRLPLAPGFDCGDGEMIVCPEYLKYGWQSYQDGSEDINIGGVLERKDKWWLKK